MICPQCKNKIQDNLEFCPLCGKQTLKLLPDEKTSSKAHWIKYKQIRQNDFMYFYDKVFSNIDWSQIDNYSYSRLFRDQPSLRSKFRKISMNIEKEKQYGLQTPYTALGRKWYLPYFINELLETCDNKILKKNIHPYFESLKDEYYEADGTLYLIYLSLSEKNTIIFTANELIFLEDDKEGVINIMNICAFDVTRENILINNQIVAKNNMFVKEDDIYALEAFVRSLILLLQMIHTAGFDKRNLPLCHWKKADPSEYIPIARDGFPVIQKTSVDTKNNVELISNFKKFLDENKNYNFISAVISYALFRFPSVNYAYETSVKAYKNSYGEQDLSELYEKFGIAQSEHILCLQLGKINYNNSILEGGIILGTNYIYSFVLDEEEIIVRRISWDNFKKSKTSISHDKNSTLYIIDIAPKLEIYVVDDKMFSLMMEFLEYIHILLQFSEKSAV